MRSMFLYLANIVSAALPQSRFFATRRRLYTLAGVEVASSAKINGLTRIHFPNTKIGANTWVGAGTQIIPTRKSSVEIGANCDLGPQVMLVTGSHEIGSCERRAGSGTSASIGVGSGTWIGARATFIAGSGVGSGCIVAAGSLVKEKFGNNVIVAGVPARVVKHLKKSQDSAQ